MIATTSNNPPTLSQQNLLFRVYNGYRLAVSLLLAGLFYVGVDAFGQDFLNETQYQATVLGYLALNVLVTLMLLAGYRPGSRHITLSLLVDIMVLHLLVLLSGGIDSGITNLVIITVAAGNILSPGRIGFFYAALAALFSLTMASWTVLVGLDGLESVVRAGFLGIIYFAAAFVLQNISRRLVKSEALAWQRARSIAELKQLNHQIIQRMRTGIVVARANGEVRLANAAAGELIMGKDLAEQPLARLPSPLLQQLEQWLHAPQQRQEPFQNSESTPRLQANFTRLNEGAGDYILIFLEDTSKLMQQAQQIKLASLGRLTAGIAHEIRNPLGAISHAAQLLAESPTIDPGDLRMTAIIQRHSQRVNGIVENVLELSRRRMANLQSMDAALWLQEVIDDYQECRGCSYQIQLQVLNQPAPARFDPTQLSQVLTNLMDNGLRYSEQRTGLATLTLRCGVNHKQQRTYIDVIDQGPGLSDQQQNTLFEPFYTTEQGGTGLGLYLARELCEANQSQLNLLDPSPGQCCFRVSFAHPKKRSQPLDEDELNQETTFP